MQIMQNYQISITYCNNFSSTASCVAHWHLHFFAHKSAKKGFYYITIFEIPIVLLD